MKKIKKDAQGLLPRVFLVIRTDSFMHFYHIILCIMTLVFEKEK